MSDSAWGAWETLLSSSDPDPIEVLRSVAHFQNYFAGIEREAIRVARAQARTWAEIGSALGKTRQAIWQRAGSPRSGEAIERVEDLKRIFENSWTPSAEVHFQMGANPP